MLEFIVNPVGASGKTLRQWKKLEEEVKKSGVSYRVHYSTKEHGIRDIAAQLTAEDHETDIVVAGGDGSLNQAVNGIRDISKVRMGLLPCGSGNDFAKSLHLPQSPYECLSRILELQTVRTVDVGEVIYRNRFEELEKESASADGYVHHLYMISCGIGFDAAICQQAQVSKSKKALNKIGMGKLIYIWFAIRMIMKNVPAEAVITVDGKPVSYDKLLFAVAMNEQYEGGGFRFCPHAIDNDRLLDICIGDHLSTFDFFNLFPKAYSGSHLKFDGVYEERGNTVEIETEIPLWVHTDGEVSARSSHIINILHQKQLRFLL